MPGDPMTPVERLSALRYSRFHQLLYVKNQKAGCTSIEYSLWKDYDRQTGQRTFKGRTHDRRSPIKGVLELAQEDRDRLQRIEVFSAVRNPFTRILSAYLHHVYDADLRARWSRRLGLWRSPLIRAQFFQAAGLDSRRSLSFREFLERIADIPPERLTGHFRPQVENIWWGRLRFDFVDQIERPAALEQYLGRHGIAFHTRARHAQHADDKTARFYDAACVDLVAHHFTADFAAFGYDPADPSAGAMRPIGEPPDGRPIGEFLEANLRRQSAAPAETAQAPR